MVELFTSPSRSSPSPAVARGARAPGRRQSPCGRSGYSVPRQSVMKRIRPSVPPHAPRYAQIAGPENSHRPPACRSRARERRWLRSAWTMPRPRLARQDDRGDTDRPDDQRRGKVQISRQQRQYRETAAEDDRPARSQSVITVAHPADMPELRGLEASRWRHGCPVEHASK